MGEDKLWVDLFGRPAWRCSLDAGWRIPSSSALRWSALRLRATTPHLPSVVGARPMPRGRRGDARRDSVLAGLAALLDAGGGDASLVLVDDAVGRRPASSRQRIVAAAGTSGGGCPAARIRHAMRESGEHIDRAGLIGVQTPQSAGSVTCALRWPPATSPMRAPRWRPPASKAPGGRRAGQSQDDRTRRRRAAARRLRSRAESRNRWRRAQRNRLRRPSPGGRPPVASRGPRLAGCAGAGRPLGRGRGTPCAHRCAARCRRAGDIGSHFPAGEAWRDADSADLLRRTAKLVMAAGWKPARGPGDRRRGPPIAPRRDELASRIASLRASRGDERQGHHLRRPRPSRGRGDRRLRRGTSRRRDRVDRRPAAGGRGTGRGRPAIGC